MESQKSIKTPAIRDNGDGGFRRSSSLASAAVVTLSQRTDALVRGLDLVLEHHGCEPSIREDLANQYHSYLDNSLDETVWLKRAKFALTYPLSKYLKNVLPPAPDVLFKPSGALRAWMKPRFNAFNRKNTHLWYSWFQAKRSSLPASDEIVDATYEKHFATLTKVDKGDESTMEEIFSIPTFQRLLEKIRKQMTDILDGASPFEERSASGSACFEQTRGKGGQHGELLRLCGLNESRPSGTELHSMRCDPVVYSRQGARYNVVTEVRCAYGRDEWGVLPSLAQALDLTKPIKCTIQAVLEPMKVRVISKGEALPYYTCRPLQKALHTSMRHLDCFRLIGRPFSPTDMLDLKEKAASTDQWFSIDYSAATDGLSWRYAGRIFKFLIGNLPKTQYDLAMSVLGPHALHYPVKGGRDVIFRGIQQNGQLMGSILSFPILCLANLGVYLAVTAQAQQGWTDVERLRHVLVNGDDMVYAADKSLWERHVETAGKVGLEMSVGKAYQHREYANINSTSVHLALDKPNATPWQINYLNAGLFFGQHKVQERVDTGDLTVSEDGLNCRIAEPEQVAYLLGAAHLGQDPAKGLAVNLNVLLDGSLPGRQTSLLKRFLLEHPEDLRRECSMVVKVRGRPHLATRNLFLPLSLGGMGVNAPCGWKYEVKPVQQQIALACLESSTAPISCGFPLPGYPLSDLETELTVPWVKRSSEIELFSCVTTAIKLTRKRLNFLKGGVQRYCLHSGGVAA